MTVDLDQMAIVGRTAQRPPALAAHRAGLVAAGVARLHRILGAQVSLPDLELIVWSGLFDGRWYRAAYADLVGRQRPLRHFAREGAARGLDPNSWFSTADYVRRHGAHLADGRVALAHFVETMLAAGLDPRRRADVAAYLKQEAPPAAAPALLRRAPARSQPALTPPAASPAASRISA